MIAWLALALVALATPAHAHGTLPGGGGFYAGLAHPFLAWEHLLLLVALGLLLGRHPRGSARIALLALALALAAGLAFGTARAWPEAAGAVLIATLVAGAAIATAMPVPPLAATALAAACGLAIGLDTGVPVPQGGVAFAPYAGVLVGVFLIALDTMALASVAHRPPGPIAVRIAGSWIVAVAAMLLALQLQRLGTA